MDDAQKQTAAALGRIPSGLFVVTVRKGAVETGLLASWVQQCSFEPPMVTLAVKKTRDILTWLTEGAAFGLNVLDATQTDMIIHFGKGFAPGEPVFQNLEVDHPGDGPAALQEALAYVQCQVKARYPAGDHELIVGQVVDGKILNEGQPMVHVRKSGAHY